MPSTKELCERAKPLAAKIRQLSEKVNAEGRDFTAEETAEWTKVNDDYNALGRAIERNKVADEAEAKVTALPADWQRQIGRADFDGREARKLNGEGAEAVIGEAQRALAINAWCRTQMGEDLDSRAVEACRALNFNPLSKQLRMPLFATEDAEGLRRRYRQYHSTQAMDRVADFKATLTMGSGPGGGYLTPPETLLRKLEINLLYYGGMRQVAETMRTASGERMSWPTADDTTNTGAQLGEAAAIGSSVDPVFAKVFWDAYKFSSKPILVPYELIQDSVFNLPAMIGEMFGTRLGRITNTKYTSGTGAATPFGLIAACVAKSYTFAAASATAISSDDVYGLYHSVDPAYRAGFGFMLHDTMLLNLRKLKDGQGRPLWTDGLQDGIPDRLLGQPLTINQDMDSTMSSGKHTIAGGQLSRYKIRTVGEARMYRLEERYRDNDEDGFLMLIREDGNLLTSGTAPVKVLTH